MAFHPIPFLFAPFGFFLMVLLVGVIGYAGFRFVRNNRRGALKTETNQPLDFLRYRYANGEIDGEEFKERKGKLVR